MTDWLKAAETKQLKDSIDWHLANVPDDRSLRDRLEGMATSALFRALAWYWAPKLYSRNRAIFRPFIQRYFANIYIDGNRRWERIEWSAPIAASLDPWLIELERAGESNLFRKVYEWKHQGEKGYGVDSSAWSRDLLDRFSRASPAQRVVTLKLFDMHAQLDEETAIALYRVDSVAGPFILKHLPRQWLSDEEKRVFWRELGKLAQSRGDHDFYFRLYRAQIPIAQWKSDSLELCRSTADIAQLNQELELRHPQVYWATKGIGPHFVTLLEARGRDVLPYLRKHLRQLFGSWRGKSGYDELVALAKKRGWIDVATAAVVICGDKKQYNDALRDVLQNTRLTESERIERLRMFSGVSAEWNGIGWGLARVQQLEQDNALALYERYPNMLRQTFKAHVTPAWGEPYFELFERAWNGGDEELADYLASRYVTRSYGWGKNKENISELVAEKFVALKMSETDFARRAANVLTLVPAYSIYNYNHLVRENRLARLLFERSLRSFLDSAAGVRDLVEGGEVHVQQLAYRVLGLDDERARTLARQNLDILIGTVLRPLHRRTRFAAFGALLNAASEEQPAARVLAKAREAFALPNKRYPKEQLVGLIAKILARFPSLAAADEQPVIYRRAG